ncbi:MAG: hypothetical protein ACI94Z_002253 [Yoonia sp.]
MVPRWRKHLNYNLICIDRKLRKLLLPINDNSR